MKKQTRFQIACLLIGCMLSSGLVIQNPLFTQSVHSVKSIAVTKVVSIIPNVNDIAPNDRSTEQPYIDAGEYASVCEENSAYELNGTSTFASKTLWETDGDGQFSDPTSLNSIYKPGKYDISNGEVTLFLYLLDPDLDGPPIFDVMILSIARCIDSADDNKYE